MVVIHEVAHELFLLIQVNISTLCGYCIGVVAGIVVVSLGGNWRRVFGSY